MLFTSHQVSGFDAGAVPEIPLSAIMCGTITFHCGARRPGFACVTGLPWNAVPTALRCAAGHPMIVTRAAATEVRSWAA